jgi:ATP-dependent 26S proteasome regulatory subunit
MIVVAATNHLDAILNYLQWPGRLEREVVLRPPDLGKRLKLLRGMLLGPLMASGLHDDNKPAIYNNDNKYKKIDDKAGLKEVANVCVGFLAANLLALVQRAGTLGIKEALGGGPALRAAFATAPE